MDVYNFVDQCWSSQQLYLPFGRHSVLYVPSGILERWMGVTSKICHIKNPCVWHLILLTWAKIGWDFSNRSLVQNINLSLFLARTMYPLKLSPGFDSAIWQMLLDKENTYRMVIVDYAMIKHMQQFKN